MKITKYKNKYLSCIQKQFSKFAVVLVVVSMLFGTLDINQTSAYFTSSATVTGNTFTAGTLAFHLNPSTDFTSSVLAKGGTASYSTTLANDGSLGFQYTIEATNLNTDVDLCNALTLQATNGAYTYNGSLSSFSAPARSYDTSAWSFVVTLPSGADDTLQDKICNFKFTFNGWQEGLQSSQGFSDSNQINGTISSGHWVAPIATINPGDVVINELMWSGSSTNSDDEWLELRNMTSHSIDIGGWQLTKKDSSGNQVLMVTIPSGKTISQNGFFLISEFDQAHSAINVAPDLVAGPGSTDSNLFALANDKLQIKLYKGDWNNSSNLIDTADDGAGNPAVGLNDTTNNIKKSMERNDTPGNDGTLATNWHACTDSGCNSEIYWDTPGGNNYGTPGGPNLSKNDPTSPDYDSSFVPEEPIASEEIPPATEEEVAPAEEQLAEEVVVESVPEEEIVLEKKIVQEEPVKEVTVVEPVLSVEPEELLPSAPLPEEIPPASPDEVAEVVE
jgi:hypothetical protein